MKLLRIKAEGLPLFKDSLDLTFYAQQRVAENHRDILFPLTSNIYLNPTTGFIGINASGKTSVLKVILFVLGLLNHEPINHISSKDILGDTNRSKNKVWKKWTDFIGDAGKKESFANSPKSMSIESNAAWLAIDASASLGKLASCLEVSYSEILGAYISRWIRKIDNEHLQAINQYRREKGLETFKTVDQIIAYHLQRSDFPDSFHQETIDYILAITTTPSPEEKETIDV